MPVVSTSNLCKNYGRIAALRGVSVTVEAGTIYGLLGQNGAGKSTLVKILLGIVKKSNGEANLLGAPAGTTAIRNRVGYLPEDHLFPGYHSARSLLDFYGRLYGLSRAERRGRADEALDVVGLRKRMDSKIRTYSKGMKQRLGIAQAFFHNPDVIFLDEPTDGVDPVGRKEIRDLLQRLKSEGCTIFVNSHLLGEVELISDRVAILNQGQIVREGTVADLTRQTNRYTIRLADGQAFPTEDVRALGFPVTAHNPFHDVEIPEGKTIDPVLHLLQRERLSLRHLVETKQTLEDVFVQMVESGEPGTDRRQGKTAPLPTAKRAE
ncbi:MAG: ABC transporter ATP-binding protein [Bacteroidales bacterium]|nr:ABC transporter ATP-binding protein [Bacteroidales bacterium]